MEKFNRQKTVLLAGAGSWGKHLARNLHSLGVLHTICDVDQVVLNSYSSLYPGLVLTTNYREALENPRIDKVVIAAPASLHYPMAKQALLAGKDVFVEKPLCLNHSEGEELVALSKQKNQILMTGHLLQYHPCILRLQEMISSGILGKLQYIESNRLNLGSIRKEENALWSFAPHDISIILSLCGNQLPESVRCVGQACLIQGIPNVTMTTMKFSKDLRAHIFVSWLYPYKEQKLIVIGTSGIAMFDDTKAWNKKLILYRNPIHWKDGITPLVNKHEGESIEVPEGEPLRNECEHFLYCCMQRVIPKTDGNEGLKVLQVLQAAQSSLDKDGEIQLFSNFHLSISARNYFSHPTASIHATAEIADGTKIWHYSHIMERARIGRNCNIGQNVVVSPEVILGDNVKVQNNVSIYTGVICEDDVFLGPSMAFTNVINPRSAVSRREHYQKTFVERGTTIGANATIICGIKLGQHCFIGAGAVVTKDVKPFALVVGNPARQIGWMSRHGERLDLPLTISTGKERQAACRATGEIYLLKEGLLFLGGV